MLTRDEIEENGAGHDVVDSSTIGDRDRRTEEIPARVAAVVGVAVVALNVVVLALFPAADQPEVAQGWTYAIIDLMFWATAIAAIAGLASRRRYGLTAAFVHAGVLAVAVVACPVTGHHAYGPWWLGQVAASGALLVVTATALRTTHATGSPAAPRHRP